MTNTQSPAPGADEATIQRLMSLAADWKRLPGMSGESVDAQDALRAALRAALQASAAAVEPVAYRARRSEPGMIGHYPWTYTGRKPRLYGADNYEIETLYTEAQVQAMLAAAPQPPASALPLTAWPPTHLEDGTENPAWLTFKHGTLNPALEAATRSAQSLAVGVVQAYQYTDSTLTLQKEIADAIVVYARSKPEDDENWELWFEAAFDLVRERIDAIFTEFKQRSRLAVPAQVQDANTEKMMRQWDYWRKQIANGDKSSGPRDWFESVVEFLTPHTSELQSLREADEMLKEIGAMCRDQTMFVGSYAEIVRQALASRAATIVSHDGPTSDVVSQKDTFVSDKPGAKVLPLLHHSARMAPPPGEKIFAIIDDLDWVLDDDEKDELYKLCRDIEAQVSGGQGGLMKSDCELLELAAKAAGYAWTQLAGWSPSPERSDASHWNPLTDGGDAIQLAGKLKLDIEHGSPLDNSPYICVSRCGIEMVRDSVRVVEEFDGEIGRVVAMCRAIVRAAAEIGAAIPPGGIATPPSTQGGTE